VSNGRLTVDVTPLERWLTMPQPTSAYNPVQNGDNMYRYVRDAVSIADPLVDFSRYDDVALVNAPGWASGDLAISLSAAGFPPVVADGKPIRFGTFYGGDQPAMLASRMRDVFIHETLHTLGLPDLGGRAVGYDPLAVNDLPQPTHVLGWHKWILGWIDPLQITCVASGTLEETLSPIAVAAGKKLVVVPVDEWTAYVVEARRRIGWDRNLCDEGVILYRVDSRRMGGDDPVLMNGPLRCGRFTPGAFDPGQTVEDEHVRLQVLATDGQSYRVRVTKK
jgi:M6 family metalloprotease-like protein